MTGPDRLRELAADPVLPVRLWTARNPNVPADAFVRLIVDEDNPVRWNAITNPGVPPAALRHVAALEADRHGDQDFTLRENLAHHPNATAEFRAELIKAGTCRNPASCPEPWYYRNRFHGR
ncbi:hypothetical protein IU448_04215 [Nocardia flavorosea]|uniref:hypothetical protein n=1 Tax=Nocardia flavorosea TaxID=53429 RepID=UPI001892D80D|nr:hypothetical protein [Nocardia flavorosea]MBF6348218.1 hypothetical protein [Nocardia flavorosea]